MPQHDLNFIGCPSLDQLRELEQNVKFLKAEKVGCRWCIIWKFWVDFGNQYVKSSSKSAKKSTTKASMDLL